MATSVFSRLSRSSSNTAPHQRTSPALRRLVVAAGILTLLLGPAVSRAQSLPSIEDTVAGAEQLSGYFTLYWNDSTGQMYWEIGSLHAEFLYQVSMASGLGSNPVGIDRGQLSGTYVLTPKRIGPRLLLMQPNYRYRASSTNELERQAVEDSFAPSVLWGFDIVAETEGRVLVDASDFFLRDARNVAGTIANRGQGRFTLDVSRSAFYLDNTKAFPENVEIETLLTFASSDPGRLVSGVAANGNAITLRQHHSLVKLPDDNFRVRLADPRIGTN